MGIGITVHQGRLLACTTSIFFLVFRECEPQATHACSDSEQAAGARNIKRGYSQSHSGSAVTDAPAVAYFHVDQAQQLSTQALEALAEARFRPAIPLLAPQLHLLHLSQDVPAKWLHAMAQPAPQATQVDRAAESATSGEGVRVRVPTVYVPGQKGTLQHELIWVFNRRICPRTVTDCLDHCQCNHMHKCVSIWFEIVSVPRTDRATRCGVHQALKRGVCCVTCASPRPHPEALAAGHSGAAVVCRI